MTHDWEHLLNSTAERANRSTVPILATQFAVPVQHGTGTLIRVADYHFLVSAAHVLIRSIKAKVPLYIAGEDESLVFLQQGNAIYTPETEDVLGEDDPFDLAIWKLDEATAARLSRKQFLDQTDISAGADCKTGRFVVFGYPEAWSAPLEDAPKTIAQAPIAIHAGLYSGSVDFSFYNPDYHLLLGFSAETAYNAAGNPHPLPKSLRGISGCSIWKLFDEAYEANEWKPAIAKVVAVQTGLVPGGIKGTRWPGVLQAMVANWPELIACFNIWFPDRTPIQRRSTLTS